MWWFAMICIGFLSVTSGGISPLYSPSYANVYYQGAANYNPQFDPYSTKEEVTEPTTDDTLSKDCDVNPTNDTDTATEPYSESVNFTKIHRSQGPKKLHEAIELSDEFDPTAEPEPDLEPTYSPDVQEQGVYYIYHPNGLLQRIVFTTKDDVQNMEYLANFNYQNVEPIVDPIYTYDPSTLLFQRLQLL